MEVVVIAHRKNLQITDLPNVTFGLAGAQDIPLDDETVDIVLMFKSLHHVPVKLMETSLREIRRVLKPAGLAYTSEQFFFFFNEIIILFHNEQEVREAAFDALKKSVNQGWFCLIEETFFNTKGFFKDFSEFENTVINATHSNHSLDKNLHEVVKKKFEKHLGDDGAHFLTPVRVDLLQKL